ncbi:SUMF1/EgtB/PvdO family nonheme iron enzyme [Marinicella sp. W31]|uniref:formylglycine-generating enzyme family protein n=1 Tax=Marinicella sp. W31 TaxID=3023713 RepID=UPI0037577F35
MLALGISLIVALYILKTQPDILKRTPANPLLIPEEPLILRPDEQTQTNNTRQPEPAEILDVPIPTWELPNQTNLSEVTATDYLIFARQATLDSQLFQPENQNTLYYLNLARQLEPDNPDLQAQLKELEETTLNLAALAIADNNPEELSSLISRIKNINPENQLIQEYATRLNNMTAINRLLDQAETQIREENLYGEGSEDAWHRIKQAQEIDSNQERLISLENRLIDAFIAQAVRAAQESDFEMANTQVELAMQIRDDTEAIALANGTIDSLKQARYAWLDEQFYGAIDGLRFGRAQQMITDLQRLDISTAQIEEYQQLLQQKRIYGRFQPFQAFKDSISSLNTEAPQMVVMPTGQFTMGSDTGKSAEQPAHTVRINYAFAISQHEITVADFARFVEATNHQTSARLNRSGRIYDTTSGRLKNKPGIDWQDDYAGKKAEDNTPVIHVSWEDAYAYTQWLSEQTGYTYRLPSEAEFEYVLAAGNRFKYPWGDEIPSEAIGNFTGREDRLRQSRARWREGFEGYTDGYWGPAPVGSFVPNLFGVNDMSGNVMEWVQDCWHDSYVRAPADGSAWYNPGCEDHVIRGGSWSSSLFEYQVQHRYKAQKDYADPRLGFRIVRDLQPR